MVAELITDDGVWNELIRAIFVAVDATAILRIPIRQQDEDWWSWELDNYGVYSVKSAYRKLKALCDE
jgi:hypothetical protein